MGSSIAAPESTKGLVEHRTIGPVPLDERRGSGRGLFGIWFGINMLPLTVVTGALATTVFGLPFWWGVLANVIGQAIGGVLMALHASQGPTLGVPQMLQARGQFGSRGASIIVVAATVLFIGFYISNLVVGSQSLNQLVPGIPTTAGIFIAVAVSMAVTVVGLPLIMRLISISAVVIGLLVVVAFVAIATKGIPAGTLGGGSITATGFFSVLAVGAVWQIAYAPYVSDYSRYLPADGGTKGAFWGTYLGSVISSSIAMALGALLGVLSASGDPIAGLKDTTGSIATVLLLAFALVSMLGNAGNVYCATLTTLTFVETFRSGWIPAARGRLVTAAIVHVVGMVVALLSSANFLSNFTSFITLLLYLLIPWSAINLVDYFLVSHSNYAVDDFFKADGGRYGRWNVPALAVYVIGIAVQVPFMVLPFYTGPIAAKMNGVDLAWVLGFAVSGLAYLAVTRRSRTRLAASPATTPAS